MFASLFYYFTIYLFIMACSIYYCKVIQLLMNENHLFLFLNTHMITSMIDCLLMLIKFLDTMWCLYVLIYTTAALFINKFVSLFII